MQLLEVWKVVLIFFCFASVHSILAARTVKVFSIRLFGEYSVKVFYRFFYTCLSAATALISVVLLLNIPDVLLFDPPSWLGLTMRAVQFSGIIFGMQAFKNMDFMEFSGISQVLSHVSGQKVSGDMEGMHGTRLVKEGVYGIVRHPLYFAGIVVVSCSPVITRNWLVVSVLCDIYFVAGALIEERRHIKQFGEEYRQYMKQVPMLIPRIFCNKQL